MSRYNRKVNRVLQAARLARTAKFVLGCLGGPFVGADPDLIEPTDDWADSIQVVDLPLGEGGQTGDFRDYSIQLLEVFNAFDSSTTGWASTLLEYMDGGYAAFNGGTPAPEGQIDDLRQHLANPANSNYNATITGLGAEGDPLAKLLEYVVANGTFPV